MVWEAIAGPAIEAALSAAVGTGPHSVTHIEGALEYVAAHYGADATSAVALLYNLYPVHEVVQGDDVAAFLMAVHAGGHLAATRDSAAHVLMGADGADGMDGATGATGMAGMNANPADVVSMVWQAIAGCSISRRT